MAINFPTDKRLHEAGNRDTAQTMSGRFSQSLTDCILSTLDVTPSGATITGLTLHRLDMPLTVPYKLSYRTFTNFEPYVVEVTLSNGRTAISDGHISPGSSAETRDGGWAFCLDMFDLIIGQTTAEAFERIAKWAPESKVAASAMITALELAEGSALTDIDRAYRLPLLAPVNGATRDELEPELNGKIEAGFKTFKIKVGQDVDADLARVATIQAVVGDRATLRIDANRAYSKDDGCRFASAIDPTGIELFEQPCEADLWDDNAAVAKASNVPLMLDEPICGLADIERAANIDGVGLCKLKLKRFVSLGHLARGLNLVRELGMEPVLGDGLGSEITSWLEACVATKTIKNAGEFNGFLKPRDRLFETELAFDRGDIVLPAGYAPAIDRAKLDAYTAAEHAVSA